VSLTVNPYDTSVIAPAGGQTSLCPQTQKKSKQDGALAATTAAAAGW